MANAINIGNIIAKDALARLSNTIHMIKSVNREYAGEFTKKRDFKQGDSFDITKPARFVGRTGKVFTPEDYKEEKVKVSLTEQLGVDLQFDSQELTNTFNIDEFGEKVIQPGVDFIASQIEAKALEAFALATYNAVGTPGTTPNALKTFLQAGEKMSLMTAPKQGRSAIIDPSAQVEMVDTLKGLVQSSNQLKTQYEDGLMERAAGFDWYESQSIYSHTTGQQGGVPLVNGVGQSGALLVTDGWSLAAANRLKKGDIFTIANVFAVNPITKKSTGKLQQFVVTADAASDAGGNATLAISPAIVLTGSTQNVTAGPVDNAAITVLGGSSIITPVNLAYVKDAFTFLWADLPVPGGVDHAGRATSKKAGLSVRFVRQYDSQTDMWRNRLDVLCGFGVLRPEWACRVHG